MLNISLAYFNSTTNNVGFMWFNVGAAALCGVSMWVQMKMNDYYTDLVKYIGDELK